MKRTLLALWISSLLIGCSPQKSRVDRMEDEVSKIARQGDVLLEKEMQIVGGWAKVSLFFGYVDNLSACSEFVEAMKRDQPQERYRCAIVAD